MSSYAFTRATAAYIDDHLGAWNVCRSGEARFGGMRRVENLLVSTTTLSTQGVTTLASAYTLSFSGTGSVVLSGTSTKRLDGQAVGTRVSLTFTATSGALTLTVSGTVTDAQLELGNVMSEYVSNGVEAAPYQGSGVDGVWYSSYYYISDSYYSAPLTTHIESSWPGGVIAFTTSRATAGYVDDHLGVWNQAKAGEMRFGGARRVENLLTATSTLGTQGVTTKAQTYTVSMYGTGSITLTGTATGTLNGTGVSDRVSLTFTATAGSLTLTVAGSVTDGQLETGSSMSEYISVGVLSAPFHGAGADGVAYFDYTYL
jgi:hypothetical protein